MRSSFGAATRAALATAFACVALCIPALVPSAGAATRAPVVAGFKANSITWLGSQQGWVLGNAPCGSQTCTFVLSTKDGGTTWRTVGRIPASIPILGNTGTGVTEIRFATPLLGWAFAPGLWQTTDGGRSWAPVALPGNGKQVLDLAVNQRSAYAVISPCAFGTGFCTQHPLAFWRRSNSPHRPWTSIPVLLPMSVTVDVSAYGRTVYVADAQEGASDAFYASTNGSTFSRRPVPCADPGDTDLVQTVPTSPTDVSLLCIGDPGFSKSVKTVYRSTDTAKTVTSAGTTGLSFGIQSQLAASPSGNLAIASWSDGSFMYINDTGGTTWTEPIASGDGGAGWNDVVFTGDQVAWVVFGPADFFADYGALYMTTNAGETWTLVTP